MGEHEHKTGFCHPGVVLNILGVKLEENAVICVDVGDCTLWISKCLCLTKANQRTLASMRMGTMGYSIYATMAAAALCSEAQVVGIAGDGGIQMAVNELATLVDMQANVVLIVLVNSKLGRVHNESWGPPDAEKPHGCELVNPDFCVLAEAYGAQGVRLNTDDPQVVSSVLDEALKAKGVFIIELMQHPDVKPFMFKKRMPSRAPPR